MGNHSIEESQLERPQDSEMEKTQQINGGLVVDNDGTHATNLKLALDGHTILVPQPSDNRQDPLNWSYFKKHLFLFIIASCAFLPDYGSAVGAVTLLPQAQ